METLSFLVITGFVVFFLVKVPLVMLFNFNFPLTRLVVLVLALLSVPFALTVDSRSIDENNRRLAQWQADRCVAPGLLAQSVFIVEEAGETVGTAFLLEGGRVVTNSHVAESVGEHAEFRTVNGTLLSGQLDYAADKYEGSDIAFYTVEGVGNMPQLRMAAYEAQAGDRLLAVGQYGDRPRFHPAVLNVFGTATRGEVPQAPQGLQTRLVTAVPLAILAVLSGEDLGAGNTTETTFNGDIGPGSSGSPVVNCQGELTGVIYAGRAYYLYASEQNGFAVSIEGLSTELVRATWQNQAAAEEEQIS